jgi:lipopolysaccharide biosynthesis protein
MIHRFLAFYLPQFHPIPENDIWWGKGFTAWTNVTKAKPLFNGHYQPHLPSDLGFYDLRLFETQEAQAALAKEYGIYGFCYYHYWFNGRQVLERPVDEIIARRKPDFPFCLCWANENWTRLWNGGDREILLQQSYSAEDDIAHIQRLMPIFKDRRYIRVDGRPLFLVYRASRLPDPAATVCRWREQAAKTGLPGLYLCNVESFSTDHGLAPKAGFDAAVEFAPDWRVLPPPLGRKHWRLRFLTRNFGPWENNRICRYADLRDAMLAKPRPQYLRYPGVTPMWDNTARRKEDAIILTDSTPEKYESWLRHAVQNFQPPSSEENFVFINAWNEWAEGNHLEPCQKWGRAYLEATKHVFCPSEEEDTKA